MLPDAERPDLLPGQQEVINAVAESPKALCPALSDRARRAGSRDGASFAPVSVVDRVLHRKPERFGAFTHVQGILQKHAVTN